MMTPKTLGTLLLLPLVASAAPALRSNMLVTTDWLGQHLNDPKLVVLHVRRLPEGSPIRGKLWVDDFRLAPKRQ